MSWRILQDANHVWLALVVPHTIVKICLGLQPAGEAVRRWARRDGEDRRTIVPRSACLTFLSLEAKADSAVARGAGGRKA